MRRFSMQLEDLIKQTRSCRRFQQKAIKRETVIKLIDYARLTASAANLQPLKYYISTDSETNRLIFPCTAWAGYLTDWDGPSPEETPMAYIIILQDKNISKNAAIDIGIAAQTIALSATEHGIASCMIGSLKREQLHKALFLPHHLEIALVMALGIASEKFILEDATPESGIKYYRDANSVHHVPKRPLSEIIINLPDSPRA